MKRILCYGDSNTWGYDAEETMRTGYAVRFPEDVRWTGVMQRELGGEYRVLEEGLNGRTTVLDVPSDYGRNGEQYLQVALDSCSPFDCVILMLGTNDLLDFFHSSAFTIGRGMARLVRTCRTVLPYTASSRAKILIAAPLNVRPNGDGQYQYDFSRRSTETGDQLRREYRLLAQQLGCEFFDVNDHVQACAADGVHLDAESHRILGEALAKAVRDILNG